MDEPAWLRRAEELQQHLAERLREAQQAITQGDADLRRAALDAAAEIHQELEGALREGSGYFCGLAAALLRPRRRRGFLRSDAIH